MNKEERARLTQIIEAEEGINWWQPDKFETYIRSELPIELKIVSVPPSEAKNFNCFVYALGLENNPEFLGGQNPIQKEFIRHLLANGFLQIIENPHKGDLVFYEDATGAITHSGILEENARILSKWMWGPLFSHREWGVPSSFGDKVFYCKSVDSSLIKVEYLAYGDSGIEIKPIS